MGKGWGKGPRCARAPSAAGLHSGPAVMGGTAQREYGWRSGWLASRPATTSRRPQWHLASAGGSPATSRGGASALTAPPGAPLSRRSSPTVGLEIGFGLRTICGESRQGFHLTAGGRALADFQSWCFTTYLSQCPSHKITPLLPRPIPLRRCLPPPPRRQSSAQRPRSART